MMTTSVIPYLCMTDEKAALDFYVKAFGAVENRCGLIQKTAESVTPRLSWREHAVSRRRVSGDRGSKPDTR